MSATQACDYQEVVREICDLAWERLSAEEVESVGFVYYYFSIQFRESLEAACRLYPEDEKLQHLRREECATDNLSPWPGVAKPHEKMNHDEFMRRSLLLSSKGEHARAEFARLGERYLSCTRSMSEEAQARSIASYEDGGLECVFTAFLRARHWDGEMLQAFRHFLTEHIRFDSDAEDGHGALSRHIVPDDRILPLWTAFRDLLVDAVPSLRASEQELAVAK